MVQVLLYYDVSDQVEEIRGLKVGKIMTIMIMKREAGEGGCRILRMRSISDY